MQPEAHSQKQYVYFEGYRILLQDHSNNKISLEITNSEKTKMFRSDVQQLKKTNTNALKSGLVGNHQSIKISLKEYADHLDVIISVAIPFLPLIEQTVGCKLQKHLTEQDSNKISLLQINRNFSCCRDALKSFRQKPKSNIKVSVVQSVKQYNYTNDGYESQIYSQDQHYNEGILQLGKLELQQSGNYLMTLSLLGTKMTVMYCYYGSINNPVTIFTDANGNYMNQQIQNRECTPMFVRQKVFISERNLQFRLTTIDNGNGSEYYNIILSAEKLND